MKKRFLAFVVSATLFAQVLSNTQVYVSAENSVSGNDLEEVMSVSGSDVPQRQREITNYEELGLTFPAVTITTTEREDGNPKLYTLEKAEEAYVLPQNVTTAMVQSINFVMKMNISNNRSLQAGDYFFIDFDPVTEIEEAVYPLTTGDGTVYGHVLFERVEEADHVSHPRLTVIFTEEIEQDKGNLNLRGSVMASMELDQGQNALSSGQDTYLLLSPSWYQPQVLVLLPSKSTELAGMQKTASVDPLTNEITWTVLVGTKQTSAGLPLKGIELIDTPDGWQEMVETDAWLDGQPITLTFQESDQSYHYLVPADSAVTAPATLQYHTRLTEEAFKKIFVEESLTEVSNTIEAKKGSSDLAVDGLKTTGTASDFRKLGQPVKSGERVDEKYVKWTILVNKNKSNIYKADVWDQLEEVFQFIDSDEYPVTLIHEDSGTESRLERKDTVDEGAMVPYYTLDGQRMTVHFGSFWDTYRIVFYTEFDPEKSSGTQDSFQNQAFARAYYPWGGSGIGPSREYGSLEVEMPYYSSYVQKAVEDKDFLNGLITWSVRPFTKMQDAQRAVLEDVIEDNQLYVPGSFRLTDLSGNPVDTQQYTVAEPEKNTANATGTDTTLRVVFRENIPQVQFNTYKIIYQTKALPYFYENDQDTVYSDTVTLDINGGVSQATAKTTMPNRLIEKSGEVIFDDMQHVGYFHYVLLINQSHALLSNLQVEDDLSQALTYTLYGSDAEEFLEGSYFEVCPVGTGAFDSKVQVKRSGESDFIPVTDPAVELQVQGKQVTLQVPDNTSDTYRMDLYVRLTQEGIRQLQLSAGDAQGELKNAVISGTNQAVLRADNLGRDGVEAEISSNTVTSTSDVEKMINKLLTKQWLAEGQEILWTLNVNPMGADIAGDTIEDLIPEGLYLDRASIRLYEAVHEERGTGLAQVSEGTLLNAADTVWKVKKQSDGKTLLTIQLPDAGNIENHRSYQLTYTTHVVDIPDNGVFTNSASLKDEMRQDTATAHAILSQGVSSGGSKLIKLKLKKVDSLSSAENGFLPIAGAQYGLYEAKNLQEDQTLDEADLVDSAYTDANGECILSVLDTEKIYYIQEIGTPDTSLNGGPYKWDSTVYGPYVGTELKALSTSLGTNLLSIGAKTESGTETYFKDERESTAMKTTDALFEKVYVKTNPLPAGMDLVNLTSEFKLYLYPTNRFGSSIQKEVAVVQTGEGVYAYLAEDASQEEKDNAVTVLQSTPSRAESVTTARGSLSITGLPWGYYGLEEISTPDGFQAKSDTIHFFRVEETQDHIMQTDYYDENKALITDAALGEIINTPTNLVIRKRSADHQEKLSDAAMENLQFSLKGQNLLGGDEILLTGAQLQEEALLYGVLKTDTEYTLTEVSAPYGYQAIAPLKFVIDSKTAKVKITESNNAVILGYAQKDGSETVDRNTLTVLNKPITLTVKLTDQNGVAISSQQLTLQPATSSEGVIVDKVLSGEAYRLQLSGGRETLKGNLAPGNYLLTQEAAEDDYLTVDHARIQITVNADGTFLLGDITENGAAVDNRDGHFGVRLQGTELTITNHRVLAHAKLKKVDEIRDEIGLSGAKFALYRYEGSTPDLTVDQKVADNLGTDAQGMVETKVSTALNGIYQNLSLQKGLPVGKYYFVEQSAPTGYKLPEETQYYTFEVTANDNGKELVTNPELAKNERLQGELYFTAQDALTGEVKSGVTYALFEKESDGTYRQVYGKGETGLDTVTTDGDGNGRFTGLEWGIQYALQEVLDYEVQPRGYLLNDTYFEAEELFSATLLQTQVLTEQIPICLRLIKKGPISGQEELKLLSDAEFEITGQFADGTTAKMLVTDGAGEAKLSALVVVGEQYHVEEVNAPATYGKIQAYDIVVNRDGSIKTSSASEQISLQTTKTTQMVQTDILMVDPQSDLNFLVAVERSEAFAPVQTRYTESLGGTRFGVYLDEACMTEALVGGAPVEVVSDENGVVDVPGLASGTYYLKELGWENPEDEDSSVIRLSKDVVYRAEVTEENFKGLWRILEEGGEEKLSKNTILHRIYEGDIVMTKVDKEDITMRLAGSTYGIFRSLDSFPMSMQESLAEALETYTEELFDEEGELTGTKTWIQLAKATTNEDGVLLFAGALAQEEYLVKELEAPAGHQVSANPVKLRMALVEDASGEAFSSRAELVDNGQGTVEDTSEGILWYEPRIKLQINTRDEEGEALRGVRLQLRNVRGELLEEWETGGQKQEDQGSVSGGDPALTEEGIDGGDHLILDRENRLMVGRTYTVSTIDVPTGYVMASVSFRIEEMEIPNYDLEDGYPEELIQVETVIVPEYQAQPTDKPSFASDLVEKLGEMGNVISGWQSKWEETAKTGEGTDRRILVAGVLFVGGIILICRSRRKRRDNR